MSGEPRPGTTPHFSRWLAVTAPRECARQAEKSASSRTPLRPAFTKPQDAHLYGEKGGSPQPRELVGKSENPVGELKLPHIEVARHDLQ